MMHIFSNAAHEAQFRRDGYIILPVLSPSEIEALRDFYVQHPPEQVSDRAGFQVSMDNPDKEHCRLLRDKIWEITMPALSAVLTDVKPFVASYVIKKPNPSGFVPPHQDWTFAAGEEDGYCSVTCWMPLVATTVQNGALGFVKGSHTLWKNQRPSPSPQTPVPLGPFMFDVFPYMDIMPMQPGEVVFFDNRVFHGSLPNGTQEDRLAVGVGITQKESELIHAYLKPNGQANTLITYAVDTDFFLKYDNARLSAMYESGLTISDYPMLREEAYQLPQLERGPFLEALQALGNTPNPNILEQIAPFIQPPEEPVNRDNEKNLTPETSVDTRSFFEKYTPLNIWREIQYRLTR